MTDAAVIERLGVPELVTEQPRTSGQVPAAAEAHEKRRYTYYYFGTTAFSDTMITFEDGVVVTLDSKIR